MANILVVDDEVGIRDLLSEILSDEGYNVELAQNAAQARAACQRQIPDLVLLDIWMPDTDGVTLLKEWAGAGTLAMPVIMMSGHGTIETAVEATRIGAVAFLEKPIAMHKLLHAVRHALAQAQLRRHLPPPVVPPEPAPVTERPVAPVQPQDDGVRTFSFLKPLREGRDEYEKAYFEYHLAKENGSMTRVAERTGLERTHLYRKLKQLGIDLSKGNRH